MFLLGVLTSVFRGKADAESIIYRYPSRSGVGLKRNEIWNWFNVELTNSFLTIESCKTKTGFADLTI